MRSIVRAATPVALLLTAGRLLAQSVPAGTGRDPFAFLQPTVVVTDSERRLLAQGEPVARVIAARERQVAVFGAIRVNADGNRLVAWVRRPDAYKKSPYVLAIRRFATPPTLDDLATLSLDDRDLESVRECTPGDCGVKLTRREMAQLRRAVSDGGRNWKPAVHDAFRRLMLERVETYLGRGHAGLDAYDDTRTPLSLSTRFSSVLTNTAFLSARLPAFADHLGHVPGRPTADLESFIYWSKEGVSGKPIVGATQVSIVRPSGDGLPEALVASKGIFATHYVTASLGLTALVRGSDNASYLVYLNRTELDILGGMFSGIVRAVLERRLRSESAGLLRGLKSKLESGDPSP